MARVSIAINALNRRIVNGQESTLHSPPAGATWHDLFSSQRIAKEYDELWVKRAAGGTIVGYAAVKCGATLGSELGLITIGPDHRGQGLAKELIGAILHLHPALQMYVGERNLRAQALYFSLTQRGCDVQPVGHKFYDNGEKALGILIRTSTLTTQASDKA